MNDSTKKESQGDVHVADSISRLAVDIGNRVRWELELGTWGYPFPDSVPDSVPAPAPVPASAPVSAPVSAPAPASFQTSKPSAPSTLSAQSAGVLAKLQLELKSCVKCHRHNYRSTIVFSDGTMTAKLMFVGDQPSAQDDVTGIPFIGPAGTLLNRIIGAMGLKREDVYLCNLLKCGKDSGVALSESEIGACGGHLMQQIQEVKPEVIVTLGEEAARFVLGTKEPLSTLRGEFIDLPNYKAMATYHPRMLIDDESLKRPVWEDMKKVRDYFAKSDV